MYMTIRKSTVATPKRNSNWAMENTQPPVFSVGVVEGSTGVCGDGGSQRGRDEHGGSGEDGQELAGCLHLGAIVATEDPAATDLA